MTRARCRTRLWLAWVSCALMGCGGASGTGARTAYGDGCPEGVGLCGIFVTNECSTSAGNTSCEHRPIPGLTHVDVVPLSRGVPDLENITRVEGRAGLFVAPLPPGAYRLRFQGERFVNLTFTIVGAPIVLDCRSPARARSRLVGTVRIAVGGGADGNTTISDGGPGRFLVVSIHRSLGEAQLDPSSLVLAMTDENGRFEAALDPGRYYVSDVMQAGDALNRRLGQNATPIRGQAIEIEDGATLTLELSASEMAP